MDHMALKTCFNIILFNIFVYLLPLPLFQFTYSFYFVFSLPIKSFLANFGFSDLIHQRNIAFVFQPQGYSQCWRHVQPCVYFSNKRFYAHIYTMRNTCIGSDDSVKRIPSFVILGDT